MADKLTPKIVLEGTHLTYKTDIAFALNEHPRIVGPRKYKYPSPLITAEWCAFTNYPWGRGLINFESPEEALAMETYATWVRFFEFQRTCQLQMHGRDYDFQWLEQRLLPLNFRLVFLHRSLGAFTAAREQRLRVSGMPDQCDDLSIFIREQDLMEQMMRKSILARLELDISDNVIPGAVDKIADWMESTGGTWME